MQRSANRTARKTTAPASGPARMRGLSFVEVAVLVLILCMIGFAAAPSHINARALAQTEAARALGDEIAAATRANYQRYATTGRTEGVVAVEQCDPGGFVALVGGSAARNDVAGGLLAVHGRTYRIETASGGSRFAGGISYCTIADVEGGSASAFAAVTCPPQGGCAP